MVGGCRRHLLVVRRAGWEGRGLHRRYLHVAIRRIISLLALMHVPRCHRWLMTIRQGATNSEAEEETVLH